MASMLPQSPTHYLELAVEILGAISALSTLLSQLPIPAKASAFLARVGVATGKFHVEKKAS